MSPTKWNTHNERVRETRIEGEHTFQVRDLFFGKRYFERCDIRFQLLDLAPTNNRDDLWILMKDVRDRNCNTHNT